METGGPVSQLLRLFPVTYLSFNFGTVGIEISVKYIDSSKNFQNLESVGTQVPNKQSQSSL